MFDDFIPTDSTPELTQSRIDDIYEQLKTKSPKQVFEDPSNNSSFDWQHIVIVFDEIKRLMSEFSVLVKDEQYSSFDDIKAVLSSDLLDVSTVIDDIVGDKLLSDYRGNEE